MVLDYWHIWIYQFKFFMDNIKTKDKLWPQQFTMMGYCSLRSTVGVPHSSNRYAKWLAAVNPFQEKLSVTPQNDITTFSRWRFQHKISSTARVQLLADRPCSANPLPYIFGWQAHRPAEKLNSTMIHRTPIHRPFRTHYYNNVGSSCDPSHPRSKGWWL